MVVDQLLAAGDLGQVLGGFRRRVQAADVRNHARGLERALGDHAQRLNHIRGVAAAGAHDVRGSVVHVIEIELGLQVRVGGAGEEVQAAVAREDGVALLDYGRNRREHKHVVEALAVRERFELRHWVFARSVEVNELNAVLGRLFHRVDGLRAVQARLVDVRHHQKAGFAVAMDGVVDRAQAHGARARQDGQVAALDDAHLVLVAAHHRVILRMERAHDAGERLRQRTIEEAVRLVFEQAVHQHHFLRQDGVSRVAAAIPVGVARRAQAALVVQRGLDGELIARLVFVRPFGADLHDFAAEFVADDDRMHGDVLGHALVILALDGGLVAGHANAIRNDLHQNLIVLDGGQFKGFHAQVVFAIQANRCGFHTLFPPVLRCAGKRYTICWPPVTLMPWPVM